MAQPNFYETIKTILSLDYLVGNASNSSLKSRYVLLIALVDTHVLLSMIVLPIFLKGGDLTFRTLDGFVTSLSQDDSILIFWLLLGFVLIIHAALVPYQYRRKQFLNGFLNIPMIIAIILVGIFQMKFQQIAIFLSAVTTCSYYMGYIRLKRKSRFYKKR